MILTKQDHNNSHVSITKIFQKKKNKKREHGRNRYKNMSYEKKTKKKRISQKLL